MPNMVTLSPARRVALGTLLQRLDALRETDAGWADARRLDARRRALRDRLLFDGAVEQRIRAVNLHAPLNQKQWTLVKVDRSTILGNPFPVLGKGRWTARTEAAIELAFPFTTSDLIRDARAAGGFNRGETLSLYLEWLRVAYRGIPEVRAQMLNLADRLDAGERIALGCHCKPAGCHADVLRDALIKLVRYRHQN